MEDCSFLLASPGSIDHLVSLRVSLSVCVCVYCVLKKEKYRGCYSELINKNPFLNLQCLLYWMKFCNTDLCVRMSLQRLVINKCDWY